MVPEDPLKKKLKNYFVHNYGKDFTLKLLIQLLSWMYI